MNFKKDQSIKWLAIVFTILYIAVFPAIMYLSMLVFMVFGAPNMTDFERYVTVVLTLVVPISMPVAVYYIWKRYSAMRYANACFYCILPILIAIVCYTTIECLDRFRNTLM